MRQIINISALIVFLCILAEAFNVPQALLNFILAGELPFTRTPVAPDVILACVISATIALVVSLLVGNLEIHARIQYYIDNITHKNDNLPKRRFGRL